MSFGKTATLSSGHKIPTLGYGTWQAAPGEVGQGVFEALKAGYRHLDLAKVYKNQPEVAEGIKKALQEVPGLKREDIFITSKLWNNRHKPEDVERALDETLAELQLEYLDLYLIHWPVSFPAVDELFPKTASNEVEIDSSVSLVDTWKAMTKLPKSKARTVGVSNFTIEHLETVIAETGITPAVNQVERHPRLPQNELIEYAEKKNIHITAYSAFGNNSQDIPLLINHPDVVAQAERLSKKLGKTVTGAQVVLAWAQVGSNVSVIPKSVTPSRIRANFEEVEIDDEALQAVKKIGEDSMRYNIPMNYSPKWSINIFNEKDEQSAANKVIVKL